MACHAASGPMAPVPQGSTRGQLAGHWGPLLPSAHRRGACASRPPPGVPGCPVCRRLGPLRLSLRALALRWGLPALLPHAPAQPSRRLPGSSWKTPTARDRWRVPLRAPSALCGSPVCGPRGEQVDLGHLCHRRRWAAVPLAALVSACWRDWRTAETRSVRARVQPQGLPTLQVRHPSVPPPRHHLWRACLPLRGPCRSMPLTS